MAQRRTHQTKYSKDAENIGGHGWNGAARTALPHLLRYDERQDQQMRKREPHRSQLQQAGGFRVEDAARDIDMGYGVTVEQHPAIPVVEEKRKHRNKDRQPHQPYNLTL